MSDYKNNIDQTGVNPELLAGIQQSSAVTNGISNLGFNNTHIPEFIPEFKKSQVESVINNNNSFIVLGKDRPANFASGYGGKGHTQAASIDIVVGRYSSIQYGVDVLPSSRTSETQAVDPDFLYDAARIYISQKSDIDEYFGLSAGKVGNSKGKSAIALKADGIRIIGREGVKIVSSGTDKNNSQGGESTATIGVDLIAGNVIDAELEPMVLGNKLVSFLNNGVLTNMSEFADIFYKFMVQQIKYNVLIATHNHISPFFAIPNTPSPTLIGEATTQIMSDFETLIGTLKNKINVETQKIEMTNVSINHICSNYHHLN
jgi:hypothetical protein